MDSPGKKYLLELQEKIRQLSARETILASLTSITIILGLAYVTWISPMERRISVLRAESKDSQRQLDEANILITGASGKIQDPNAPKRARIQQLLELLRTTEDNLAQSTKRLTQAADIGHIVDRAMARYPRIRLEKIENKPPLLLLQNENSVAGNLSEAVRKLLPDREFILYQHTLIISVRGPYADLVAYVRRLEDSSQHLFMGDVSLKTETYPDSILTMELITLSPNRTLFDPATAAQSNLGHTSPGP